MIDKNELAGRIDGIVLILRYLFSELGEKDVQIEGKITLTLANKSGTLTETIPVGDELILVSGRFIDEIFKCMED